MREEIGVEVARDLMKMVNCFDSSYVQPFIETVTNDHRTLQQTAMGLFLQTICAYANNYDKGRYDLRNEESCRLAVGIRSFLEKEQYVYKNADGSWDTNVRLGCI
jgi:hypothetical protein